MSWPEASLDGIARLRVLAAVLPGVVVREYTVGSPFDETWAYLSDLERSVPEFDKDVRALRITHRAGNRLRIRAYLPWHLSGLPLPMDVQLEPGWCWMAARPRIYVVGMAAVPAGEVTRVAHCEGITLTGPRALRRLAGPFLRVTSRRARRHVDHDVDGIRARLTGPLDPDGA